MIRLKRWKTYGIVLFAMSVFTIFASASPALALSDWAYGDWSNTYWVGDYYQTWGNLVGGVQIITLYDEAVNMSGPFDSRWGPQTKNAVITVQQRYGLTADGIVGSNTWWRFRYNIQSLGWGPGTYKGRHYQEFYQYVNSAGFKMHEWARDDIGVFWVYLVNLDDFRQMYRLDDNIRTY